MKLINNIEITYIGTLASRCALKDGMTRQLLVLIKCSVRRQTRIIAGRTCILTSSCNFTSESDVDTVEQGIIPLKSLKAAESDMSNHTKCSLGCASNSTLKETHVSAGLDLSQHNLTERMMISTTPTGELFLGQPRRRREDRRGLRSKERLIRTLTEEKMKHPSRNIRIEKNTKKFTNKNQSHPCWSLLEGSETEM